MKENNSINQQKSKLAKKIITNNRTMALISILCALAGIAQSIVFSDFSWFQRSGCLLVCIGILLLVRPSLVNQSLLVAIKKIDSPFDSNDPKHYQYLGEEVPSVVIEDEANRKAVNKYGPFITFAGTLIWGYGDLVNRILY